MRLLGRPCPRPPRFLGTFVIDFAWARVLGDRVYVSGHGPQAADGRVVGPFGRVGLEATPEQAADAARLATLSVLGSVRRAIGDLDRIVAWLRVDGFVLAAPGFDRTTHVINGASRLIIELFGKEVRDARAYRHGRGGYAAQLPRRHCSGTGAAAIG